ncbi:hypothetical protein M3P05_04255 [Sansalvadorimonas sp. 2012CJ34-2]|uniref:Protein kinase domain-containing protein n=1 Tax=Parendozoicomonas callyspongiae TaxID=2942213 RepID=A0ABT0PCV0_9GAMM|nr:hypothetical protein [Sansalvadorimonas sp. 2012CJ34-2]MCL6269155.1 hypothetical protein [Sansalvadorimonas sp. 2012CJ34-2]
MKPVTSGAVTASCSDTHPQECIWSICGKSYKCDSKKLSESKLKENYIIDRHVDSGWYSKIFQAHDKDSKKWAIKVVDKESSWEDRFQQDLRSFQITKGEPAIIQSRENHDLGKTGVVVVEWADGDMSWRKGVFENVKSDMEFRLLARQLLEGIEVLDRKNLYHDSLGTFDFLYVKKDGRVKLSALERAIEKEDASNSQALRVVLEALSPIAERVDLSDNSKNLLILLDSNRDIKARDILTHQAFSHLSADMTLDL